jgi:hypothetical protein
MAARSPPASTPHHHLVPVCILFSVHRFPQHSPFLIPPAPSKPKEATRDLDLEAQLEQDLMEEDADGEPDDEFEEIIPFNTFALRQEEEEEEDIPIASLAPSPPKSKPVRPRKPSESSREAPAAKTKRPAKPKGKSKREAVASDIEEEDLEFGQPARQTKRARPAPPSEGLAFPGSSSSVRTPSTAYPSSATASQRIPPPSSAPPGASDSEEEWEPVQPADSGLMIAIADSEGEEEEEIDMTAFEAEMNLQLEGSDDGLGGAVSPEPEVTPGRPMSLNQFAGGGVEASQDEDDYSSSDSEED